ncbi:MAG: hypothetical protein JXA03_11870, partial [Bacteroidales bacterium]|nr:hypothetical protein [Bacteroidales bacterium]
MNLKRKFFIIPFFLSATISAQVPFSGVSGEFILDSKPPEVSVLIPNGGESYFHLDPLMVSWSAQDESFGSNPVSIELSMDGGITYDPVLSGIPNSGTVSIDVTNLLTEHARIRVLAADTFGIANEDASDGDFIISTDFSGISAPFILDSKYPAAIVLTPNGGESVSYSGPMLVTWNASDESFGDKPISIGISTEAGGSYTIAEDSLQNTGFALINAPGVQTEFGKVWVIGTDTFGLTTEDPSDGYFTFDNSFTNISGSFILDSKYPEIAVVSPNGGESFPFAELLPVHWDAFDESFGNGPVSVEISFDGGASYEVIAAALPDLDSALLITPETISDIALIRITVTDTFGLVSNDISDDYFSLIGFKLDLKAFLEGPFILNQMIPFMNIAGVIPPGQPYDIVPWLYHGPESVPAIPNNDVIDWVLLELRDTTDASLAKGITAIDTLAAFIMNDGHISGTNGASFPVFGKCIS